MWGIILEIGIVEALIILKLILLVKGVKLALIRFIDLVQLIGMIGFYIFVLTVFFSVENDCKVLAKTLWVAALMEAIWGIMIFVGAFVCLPVIFCVVFGIARAEN